MATHRETLKIEGDTRSAREAVGGLRSDNEGLVGGLGDVAKGALAFVGIGSAAGIASQAIRAMSRDLDAALEKTAQLEALSLRIAALRGDTGVGAVPIAKRDIQRVSLAGYSTEEAQAILNMAISGMPEPWQQAMQVETALAAAQTAKLEGISPSTIFAGVRELWGAFGREAGGPREAIEMITGVGAVANKPMGMVIPALPQALPAGKAAGLTPYQTLAIYAAALKGYGSGEKAATGMEAALDVLVGGGKGEEFLAKHGLAGRPMMEKIAAIKTMLEGTDEEEANSILKNLGGREVIRPIRALVSGYDLIGQFEADIRARAAAQTEAQFVDRYYHKTLEGRNLQAEALQGIAQADAGEAQHARLQRLPTFAEMKAAFVARGDPPWVAAIRARVNAVARDLGAPTDSAEEWQRETRHSIAFNRVSERFGTGNIFSKYMGDYGLMGSPAFESAIAGEEQRLTLPTSTTINNVHNGPQINYGVKSPSDRARPTTRPAAAMTD